LAEDFAGDPAGRADDRLEGVQTYVRSATHRRFGAGALAWRTRIVLPSASSRRARADGGRHLAAYYDDGATCRVRQIGSTPQTSALLVDEVGHRGERRSSSAPKKAAALLRISLARRSSRF
jgi:hypothetical protein